MRAIPTRMRFTVLERDEFTCQYCGAKAPDAVLHVDHLIAFSKGGITSPENLITACQTCNMGKAGEDLHFIPDHILERAGNAYARGTALREVIAEAKPESCIPASPVDAPRAAVEAVESEGHALLASIRAASVTQSFVAGAVGISCGYLSHLCSGKRPIPDRLVGPLCAATGSNLLRQYADLQRALNACDTQRLVELMRASA